MIYVNVFRIYFSSRFLGLISMHICHEEELKLEQISLVNRIVIPYLHVFGYKIRSPLATVTTNS